MTKLFGFDLLIIFQGLSIFLFVLTAYFAYDQLLRNRMIVARRLKSALRVEGEQDIEEVIERRGLNARGQLKYPFMRPVNELIIRSGLMIPLPFLVVFVVLIFFVSFLGFWYLGFGLPFSPAVGIIFASSFPYFFLRMLERRRIEKFADQFPDTVDMIVRSLRVGHPVPVSLRMVGTEMPNPVGQEFMIASNELSAGLSLSRVVKNLEMRVGLKDLAVFSSAVTIQVETGGNLAELLSLVSTVMRMRIKLRRRVDAVSAEGRISGRVLSALPLFMFLAFNFLAPSYYEFAWQDPSTIYVLAVTAAWVLIGNIVISRMVDLKI